MSDKNYKKALYNSINPTGSYPENGLSGFFDYWLPAKIKLLVGNVDKKNYIVGPSLADSVADAAWRKYLGLEYDLKFLPKGVVDDRTEYKGNTVRLPKELEAEIPTDTTMLKRRIALNDRYILTHPYNTPEHVYVAKKADQQALEALRKTYHDGKPYGISEFSFNSRKWGVDKNGPYGGPSPTNALHKYNIRYDKNTNRMYYSDTYDFNQYEKFLLGTPFRFRGYVDLNDK